jgi:acetate kinase
VIDMDAILVINAGSSIVKFQVFAVDSEGRLCRQIKGQVDGIGSRPRLRATDATGDPLANRAYPIESVPDLPAALMFVSAWLRDELQLNLLAVGHRILHGGPDYDRSVLVDHDVIARLERFEALAPLHQLHNLAPIRALLVDFPALPQVACFDTAFHRGRGELADRYAIPRWLHAEGIQRYGFHGLSYEYIAKVLPDVAPEIARARVIVAHLGSSASMCAMQDGRSVECTMDFAVADGLPRDCGLKGLSGVSSDMRELQDSRDPHAAFAVDHFVYSVALQAGMLAAALQGLDGLVFTAGIGENSVAIRTRISKRLEWLGVLLDPIENARHGLRISRPDSRIPVYVVPTDEERMIAQHTLSVLWNQHSSSRPKREQAL